jgi:hypothetical protein
MPSKAGRQTIASRPGKIAVAATIVAVLFFIIRRLR